MEVTMRRGLAALVALLPLVAVGCKTQADAAPGSGAPAAIASAASTGKMRLMNAPADGELDAKFPDVDLLGFDADHDAERLASAGYVSKLIPLFALPGPDGRASGKQVEGGIKGEGAVGFIAPRLEKMLAD